jgi:WD40 repeat protein
VAFSPDSRYLATGSVDTTVRVWSATTGEEILPRLEGHTQRVYSVTFSPDGRWIASASTDQHAIVWDAATHQKVHTLPGLPAGYSHVAFSPDARRLASARAGGGVLIWDVTTGKETLRLRGDGKEVPDLAFSPDGTRLASASEDGSLKLWDATTSREPVLTLCGHAGSIGGVAFSPDGTLLATCSVDGLVKLWNVTDRPEALLFQGPLRGARDVAFNDDGTHLVGVDADGHVKLWDTTTGQVLREFQGSMRDVTRAECSADAQRLAMVGQDGTVTVWDTTTGREIRSLPVVKGATITAVALNRDGTRVALAFRNRAAVVREGARGPAFPLPAVVVREVATGRAFPVPLPVMNTPGFHSVAFSPDGASVAAGGVEKTVFVWDVATGQKKVACCGHTNRVIGALAFSRDGLRLASGCRLDTTIRIWDTTTGEQTLPPLQSPMGSFDRIVFSPDGQRLVSTGRKGVQIWEATTGLEILRLTGTPGDARGVAFSPDGHRLVSASGDGLVMWDARPLTPEGAVEREALNLLAFLFAKPLCKEDVRAFLNTAQTIPPAVRQKALALTHRYHEEADPERYHQASRVIIRQPYLNAVQYQFALRQAKTACRLASEHGEYATILGAAQYRCRHYEEAWKTLTRGDALPQGGVAALAFLAMTQHQMGQTEDARRSLDRLREVVRDSAWATNPQAADLLRETESLLPGS